MVTPLGAEAARAAIGLISAAINDRDLADSAADVELLVLGAKNTDLMLVAVATLAASLLEEAASLQGMTSRERVQQLALTLEAAVSVPSKTDEV